MSGMPSTDQLLNKLQELSVQDLSTSEYGGGQYWFITPYEDDIPGWWSPARDVYLKEFVKQPGNDILEGAISSLVKKFISMNWVLEGPQRIVTRYHAVLSYADFLRGWAELVSKTIESFLIFDKGAFWELLGDGLNGDLTGPIVGGVQGVAILDTEYCQLTGDPEYPVLYYNTKDGRPHKLHYSRVVHFVDMPSPCRTMNDIGFSSVSRVLSSSQILLKIAKFKDEQLSDMPPAGLLILSNILPTKWRSAQTNFEMTRKQRGNELWSGIMTLFGADPQQKASAEFINFSKIPDGFKETDSTELYIKILSLAFGVDIREFWPLSGGPLGSGRETQLQHQKAKGKGVGHILALIERAINLKILPKSVTFKFDFQDDEDDLLQAQINEIKVKTIMSMWTPANTAEEVALGIESQSVVTKDEVRTMLFENVPYFRREFLGFDTADYTVLRDIQQESAKQFGSWIALDRNGKFRTTSLQPYMFGSKSSADKLNFAMQQVEMNYKDGLISLDQLLDFRIGQILEDKVYA